MTYQIWCRQRNQYFADGCEFKTLDEIREQLISYHKDDMELDDQNRLYRMDLFEIIEIFEWEIHDDKGNIINVENKDGSYIEENKVV